MITAHPHADTQKKLRLLEARVQQLERARAAEQELVAAASELIEADRAVDVMVEQSWRGEVTGTVARRLAVMDRLMRAQKRMSEVANHQAE